MIDDIAVPQERLAKPATRAVARTAALILLLLLGLPVAVWLDLRSLSDHSLRFEADELASAINNIRTYYSRNVVGRVLASPGATRVVHNYQEVRGGIPIPATLSIELGDVVSAQDGSTRYRFFSDYPFANRASHEFDAFEQAALETLRQNPHQIVSDVSGSIFSQRIRLVSPVIMGGECVSCHNTHPESPKRDWKIGDVR